MIADCFPELGTNLGLRLRNHLDLRSTLRCSSRKSTRPALPSMQHQHPNHVPGPARKCGKNTATYAAIARRASAAVEVGESPLMAGSLHLFGRGARGDVGRGRERALPRHTTHDVSLPSRGGLAGSSNGFEPHGAFRGSQSRGANATISNRPRSCHGRNGWRRCSSVAVPAAQQAAASCRPRGRSSL
jgi:hypothetical protein